MQRRRYCVETEGNETERVRKKRNEMEQSSYLIERYDTKKNDNNHTPIFFHSVSFHSVSFRFGMKNCWPSLQAVFRLQNSNLSYGLFHFCDLFRAFFTKN